VISAVDLRITPEPIPPQAPAEPKMPRTHEEWRILVMTRALSVDSTAESQCTALEDDSKLPASPPLLLLWTSRHR